MIYDREDTICAQSTPVGRGGIHVIRVSGTHSLDFVTEVFNSWEPFAKVVSHQVYYGFILDPRSGNSIDEVMVTYFEHGRSFTFEDTVEISCHGNPVIVRQIIDVLIQNGCRLAERGEFTYRAYKNGRLSLTQAEAVLSLIDTNTAAGVAKSLRLLGGQSIEITKLVEQKLIWVVSRLEARIDFSTEDIYLEKDDVILGKLAEVSVLLSDSLTAFKKHKVFDRGLKTLIVGPPNAGKSSLFNKLLGSNRSIVSSLPGTTRDYLTETIDVDGFTFEIVDTAGLRLASDEIEAEGISKVQELIKICDLIILMVSADQLDSNFIASLDNDFVGKKIIPVINKIDLVQDLGFPLNSSVKNLFLDFIPISVTKNLGLDSLFSQMVDKVEKIEFVESIEIGSLRQAEALKAALDHLDLGIKALTEGLGEEFVLSHLTSSMKALFLITNENNEEIIRNKIFKDFCLGK